MRKNGIQDWEIQAYNQEIKKHRRSTLEKRYKLYSEFMSAGATGGTINRNFTATELAQFTEMDFK